MPDSGPQEKLFLWLTLSIFKDFLWLFLEIDSLFQNALHFNSHSRELWHPIHSSLSYKMSQYYDPIFQIGELRQCLKTKSSRSLQASYPWFPDHLCIHMQALVFYLLVWVFKENEQLYIT